MKRLPVTDPGVPDARSATRYLLWVARTQGGTMAVAVLIGVVWMLAQALAPAALGRGIDALAAKDLPALGRWSAAIAALGVVGTVTGLLRHRYAVVNWLGAAYRTVQVTARHAARLGVTLPKRVATGEVVSIGTADIEHIGHSMEIVARGAGAAVGVVVVAAILLDASRPLGLVVVIGVPLLMAIVALLMRPLHRCQQSYRDLSAKLTGHATDIVAGLRVLRGVGGEAAFAARYRAGSGEVRAAGVRVARVQSYLEAAQVLLPGAVLVLVTWLGARYALSGAITAGQLVAFYGYAVFLVFPLRTLVEAAEKLTGGHVAAGRVARLLALRSEISDPSAPSAVPPGDGELVDPASGLVVRPGALTAIAAADPADAVAIADRLALFTPDTAVRLDGVPLRRLALAAVRERILLADNDAHLFAGRLREELSSPGRLREELSSPGRLREEPGSGGVAEAELAAALRASCADDIVEALPGGLDAEVDEGGREFSGGQRQRLRLARALLADPPVLLLVEPTSAVDAHTEARIAERLTAYRAGCTTVVCTTSPLLLDRADHVVYVEAGRVLAAGTHADLLRSCPRYAATVIRGEGA